MKKVAEFSDKLLELKAVSGATEAQMASMTQTILHLGATTRFTATQVAAAMTNLARAGFSAAEANVAIADTLNLAQAGVIGIAEAAAIASTAVRQFGLEASDVGRIADVLVSVANSANTTVSNLGAAMKFVGPVARSLGISIEDTAAALGILADAGIDATMGGTGLRMSLVRLVSPTTEGYKAIKKLGLSLKEIDPRIVGVAGSFRALKKAGLEVTAASEIFGVRNVAAALSLANMSDRLIEATEAQKNNTLAADEAAKIMDMGLGGSLKRVSSAWDGLILNLNEGEGAIVSVTNAVAKLITTLSDGEYASAWLKDVAGGAARLLTFGQFGDINSMTRIDNARAAEAIQKKRVELLDKMTEAKARARVEEKSGETSTQFVTRRKAGLENSAKALTRLLALSKALDAHQKKRFGAATTMLTSEIEKAASVAEMRLGHLNKILNKELEIGAAQRDADTSRLVAMKDEMTLAKKLLPLEEKRMKAMFDSAKYQRDMANRETAGFFTGTRDFINRQTNAMREQEQKQRGGTFGTMQGNASFAALSGGFDNQKKQVDNQKTQIALQKKANKALEKLVKKKPISRAS